MPTQSQTTPVRPESGYSAFDIHFGRFIAGLALSGGKAVETAAALLSRAVRSGDSCLDLEACVAETLEGLPGKAAPSELNGWVEALRSSGVVGSPGQLYPLILDQRNRLYTYRYWRYEKSLLDDIVQRVTRPVADVDPALCRRALNTYFPSEPGGPFDWQKVAAVIAVHHHFCVVTGGPGTGKTFTVAKLLALLCDLHRGSGPRIHLSAPTGKAAAQLKAAVTAAREALDLDDRIGRCIPDDVHTLHRLLGVVPGSSMFYHHGGNPLPTDILVVDEASMVDVALMSKLAGALPPRARLILAGDKDQLASVEAGSVLGDICNRSRKLGKSERLHRLYRQLTGESLPAGPPVDDGLSASLSDAIAVLHHNHRFGSDSGLGALSLAVKAGDADRMLELLNDPEEENLQWVDYHRRTVTYRQLGAQLAEGFEGYLQEKTAQSALGALKRFQVLCALRAGMHGTEGINRLVETSLAGNRLISPIASDNGERSYRGRPVMITRNDYELQLFNGDVGLVWTEAGEGAGGLSTFFQAAGGGIRRIWPNRLPPHETVYAMTVHKSQGSEFDHVVLILPPADTELLTCELLYTAVTRARRRVTLWAPEKVLRCALGRRLQRSSGLRDALWGRR